MTSIVPVRQHECSQQPEWTDPAQVELVREILASQPPLIGTDDILVLRALLARAATGEFHVVQAGDCAEDPGECTADHVRRKAALLHLLAATLGSITRTPVLQVGRLAGQYAKPRSKPTEQIGGLTLPVYRGHMVNSPELDAESRNPDPLRILTGYVAAGEVIRHLGRRTAPAIDGPTVWTSHEALLLDYEVPMTRRLDDGRRWLSSTHWPWVGERTRQVDGPHVALLAEVINPVACKVGPRMTTDDLLALCERLDPLREPGRLTLISRMGADLVTERLPALVGKVRSAGHPVIWLCDPMHGNTVPAPDGRKTRQVDTMAREIQGFREAVAEAGGLAGGLHLETTPDDVTECAADASSPGLTGGRYTTLCDPRLNLHQAVSLVSAWSGTRHDAAHR
ncbi:3-deoxy-7-phosphoheptulonate synthase [Streptomyces flavidovirens]|uniref:3-deoxy-7-phosphoheptulonate synthase n=1 Tax=Streptomyces flavidovirens TaxID=67298 RepID=UPI0034194FEF